MHELKEKCGVFGIAGEGLDVARLTFFGLCALQHRGQESAGIAVSDGTKFSAHKHTGLVTQVFNEEIISSLKGHIAVGHNRYSTSAGSNLKHSQPVIVKDSLALAHNGNLPSVTDLVNFLSKHNRPTDDMSDSELMTEAIAHYLDQGLNLEEAITKAFPLFTGSFSLLVMHKNTLVGVRDQFGLRPLSFARLDGGYVFSSETCALKTIGAKHMCEVSPGEMIVVKDGQMESRQVAAPNQKLDIFEFVYFARPDSELLGRSVYKVRKNAGIELAKEYPVAADVVIPVPLTGIPAAVGYSQAMGIPYEMGLTQNRYIHRTFIQPEQHLRDQGVRLKLTAMPEAMRGQRVVLIDDSIVRGTTSRQIINMMFEAGAKEVHFLICSPPVKYPDFYGIDTPIQNQLIAFTHSVEEIRQFIGATSLHYLSYAGLIKSTELPESMFCTSFFTGVYPIDIRERKADVAEPIYKSDDQVSTPAPVQPLFPS